MITKKVLHNIPIVEDKVEFSILELPPRNIGKYFYFTVDNIQEFQYIPFYEDFGPPNLFQFVEFIRYVENLLAKHREILHFYTGPNPQTRTNAFMYILAFRMFHLKLTPQQTIEPYKFINFRFQDFRDASMLPSTFDLTHLDVLTGLFKAVSLRWLNINEFDSNEFQRMKELTEGDMSWVIPGKLIACATPYSHSPIGGGINVVTPETAIPKFKQLGVTRIIRLNQQFYDSAFFKEAGFKHNELYFDDGTVPSKEIVDQFFELMDAEDDVVALHCKAGLGRTGTLAACYLIRKFEFTPREAIAWVRICRPGSIVGPQQQFLLKFDQKKEKEATIKPPSTPRGMNPRNSFNNSKGVFLGSIFPDNYKNMTTRRSFKPTKTLRIPQTARGQKRTPIQPISVRTAPASPRTKKGFNYSELIFDV